MQKILEKRYFDEPNPMVTAVIPTKGRPAEVCRAIRTVLRQTYSNLEVIVVVDGPDPATIEALKVFSDPRIHVLVNETNLGLAETRNVGVRNSSGSWIALLDDDDEWLPAKIDAQLAAAKAIDSEYVIIASRFIERTRKIERVIPNALPDSTELFSEYLYCQRGFLQPSSFFISKKLLLDIPFTKGLPIEDTDWLLRAVANRDTRLQVLPEPLSIYNNLATEGRLGTGGPWEPIYAWGIQNRSLFTARAFALFMTKQVALKAKKNGASLRVQLHILSAAWLIGAFTIESLVYMAIYMAFPTEARMTLRNFKDRSSSLLRRSPECV